MPELIEAVEQHRKKLGRPRSESPESIIGFRLSADLVERIRASGRGYNARVEEALRKADFEKAKDEAELRAEARKAAAKKKARLAACCISVELMALAHPPPLVGAGRGGGSP